MSSTKFHIVTKAKLTRAEKQALHWAGIAEKWTGKIGVRRNRGSAEFDLVAKGSHCHYGSPMLFEADLILVCLSQWLKTAAYRKVIATVIPAATGDWSSVRDTGRIAQRWAFDRVLKHARSQQLKAAA